MEIVSHKCPLCGQELSESDDFFVCADHGNWYFYGAHLLVRAPSAEAKAIERVAMPWEHPVPAV